MGGSELYFLLVSCHAPLHFAFSISYIFSDVRRFFRRTLIPPSSLALQTLLSYNGNPRRRSLRDSHALLVRSHRSVVLYHM
jgi:hypothetical protein